MSCSLPRPIPSGHEPVQAAARRRLGQLERIAAASSSCVNGFSLEPVPPGAKPLPISSTADFTKFPPGVPLIKGVMKLGRLYTLSGPSGSGKTALCSDMSQAITAGGLWANNYDVLQGGVLICALEGQESMRLSLYLRLQADGLDLRAGPYCCFVPVNLGVPEDLDALAATVVNLGVVLIIIDTLSASLAGLLDENSNRDMPKMLAGLYRLIGMTGAAILIVHHTGHQGGRERGASALRANVDGSFLLTVKGSEIEWELVKSKDGPAGIGGRFALVPIEGVGPCGDWQRSITVKHLEPIKRSTSVHTAKTRLTDNQAMVLESVRFILSEQVSEGRHTGSEGASVAADAVVAACRDKFQSAAPKHRSSRARDALAALVQKGYLTEDDGRIRLSN